MLLGFGLCAYGLGASQFRGDELCTWWAVTLPEDAYQRLIGNVDAVLAPYYGFMRKWTAMFGDSEAAMRAPSAVAMGLCAGLVAAIGKRMAGPSVGLRAGLLFALLPVVSRYGQEARPYAFAALFATLSSLLVLRLAEKPNAIGRIVAYAAALTALGLSHLIALLILPAHAACFAVFGRQRPYVSFDFRALRGFVFGVAGSLACVFGLVVVGANQHADQIGRRGSLAELVGLAEKSNTGSTAGAILIGVVLVASGLLALFAARQPMMWRLWAVFPPVFLLASYSVLHLFAVRYIVFTLPALALLVANLLERPTASLKFQKWVTPLTVLVLLSVGFGMQMKARSSTARASGDYRAMAGDLRTLAKPGDAVTFGGKKVIPRIPRLALAYELRHGGPSLTDIFVAKPMSEQGSFLPQECVVPRDCLPKTLQRLWLLTSASPKNLYEGMPPARAKLLKKEFVVSEVREHWRANLLLLTRKAKPAVRD